MWGVTTVLVLIGVLFAAVIWGSYWFALRLFGDPERRERLVASPVKMTLWVLGLAALVAPGPLLGGYVVMRALQAQEGSSARAAAFRDIPPLATTTQEQAETAGAVAVDHGRQMVALGKGMLERGQAIGDQVWEFHGQHWVTDGNTVIDLGQDIQRISRHLKTLGGSPAEAGPAQARSLTEDLSVLRARGQALLEHSKVMGELSQVLRERAVALNNPDFLKDAAHSADLAVAMGETGGRVLAASQAVNQELDRMRRLLGQVR